MDDLSFQRELHALQQQLTGLSVQGYPISSSMDPFTREVDSLNGTLHVMEERLARCRANIPQSAQSSPTSMPSVTPSWRLANDMPHHFVGLESRLDALTKTVSDLEDRLDSLDPKCVTPSASSDGSGDEYMLPADFQNALHYSPSGFSRPYSSSLSDIYPVPDFTQSREVQSPQMAACLFPAKPEANIVPQPIQNTSHSISGFQHSNGTPGIWPSRSQETTQWLNATRSEPESDDPPRRPQTSVEGVAFRDREIDRMDERLWMLQERLKDCEAAMAEDQITIARLRLEREECRAVARKYKDRNHRLKDSILQLDRRLDVQSSRNQELESWLVASKDTREDLETALEHVQRSHEVAETRASQRSRKIAEMEDQREIDLRVYDKRVRLLQNWCREKDVEIGQKVQVISRNSSVLTQKDDEIAELHNRLRLLERERDLGADESIDLSTRLKGDAPHQECPSQSITNQDWYGDLVETENRECSEDNGSTSAEVQYNPLSTTISASAFQPEWLLPTEGPYDGSIFYGIDPSSSEHCPHRAEDQTRSQGPDSRMSGRYPEAGARDYFNESRVVPEDRRRRSTAFEMPQQHEL